MPEEKPSTKPYGVVYRIVCAITKKVYIGQTTGPVLDRLYEHCYEARRGSPRRFQQAIRKHGPESFTIEVIDTASSSEELSDKETAAIAQYDACNYDKGYNMKPAAFGCSQEGRRLLSEAFSGSNNPMFGKPGTRLGVKLSPETLAKRAKTVAAKKAAGELVGGPAWTEERRQDFQARFSGSGNPFYGRQHTEESKQKVSSSKVGKPLLLSAEQRAARAERTAKIHTGRKWSASQRDSEVARWERFHAEGKTLNLSEDKRELRREQAARMRAIKAERRAQNGKLSSDLA